MGVGTVAGAAVGSFHLNGSFTHTEDSGRTITYTGPEVLRTAWQHLGKLSSNVRDVASQVCKQPAQAARGARTVQAQGVERDLGGSPRRKSDPAVEAAEVLSVPTYASASVIKRRHCELALLHHPDKVCAPAPIAVVGRG